MRTIGAMCACSLLLGGIPAQHALDQLPADAEAWSFRRAGFLDDFTPVTLPGDGAIRGLAKLGDAVWVRRDQFLLCVDWPAKTLRRSIEAPDNTMGLAADERFLYLLSGRNLVVFDPLATMVVRTVAMPVAMPPTAFAAFAGAVHVADGRNVVVVDPRTGAATKGPPVEAHLMQWFAGDGTRLWGGDGVDCMDVAAGMPMRRWPAYLQHGVATFVDGKLLLSAEYVDEERATVPLLGLLAIDAARGPVLILHVTGTGAALRCDLAGRTFATLDELQQELRRRAVDTNARAAGATGKVLPPRVEILPLPGVLVRDVKQVWQAVVTSGLPDATCPAQEAWVRQNPQPKLGDAGGKEKR